MLSKRLIEAYLDFLLRHRRSVGVAILAGTLFFVWFMVAELAIYPNFLDLYPPRHPYIQLYQKYRSMFGTANMLVMVVEVQDGDLFSDPETVQKVDRITLDLLHNVPGVNGEQVMSLTHPKLKTTLTSGSGIKVVPLIYPRIPQDQDDLEFLRQKVYATEGVRGFFVSPDDKATLITAGFWEESVDLQGMFRKVQEIVEREQDENTKIYVTGPPILYAYVVQALPQMGWIFAATAVTIVLLLWFYFRTFQGVWIPTFSGMMSAVWGLGFAGLCGFSLDPLVLVVFILITARALSHSVQSMERYHEEYHRLHDKEAAIRKSYVEIYSPAMVSILSDGLAILTIAVASIPIMQKLAFVSSFWIISIFLSVVTLHPIVLMYVRPPKEVRSIGAADHLYDFICRWLVYISTGTARWVNIGVFAVVMVAGLYLAQQLKVGDTTMGAALLYPDHPHNVAFHKVNSKFVGASQLVLIAEGKKPEAVKDANTLNKLDLFSRYMEQGEGAGGSLTATTLLKKIFRTFHEGDPKWEILPLRDDHISQLFFFLTSGTSRGEMDRFFDPNLTNATVTIFYKDYNNEIIHSSIDRAKAYIAQHSGDDSSVRYLMAGGLLGILAAVNEEVEWSYQVNIFLILLTVFILSYLTYRSVVGALIVMAPSLVAQPLSEAVMYLTGIDFNINSLPVAAVGIGIGIDYGYYVLSRIVEEYEACGDFDEANRRAISTTGKAVIFTGTTLIASVVYWIFFPMKFQAQMALLLVMILLFHVAGALLFIPAAVSILRPRFARSGAAEEVEMLQARAS
jgi:hypothetical protein